ncbi:hypothetical protein [Mycobacteroides abscessus]|uniref:hypothetical protein n=1 Tax=Mycobacteroides abscessus TaxID=36809 RepID=UPI0009A6D59A|nr:hypothetical protein [Mycobacteroides abscessus]SKU64119.1 Uncharacterised protein [Mycobacteroides abscessus subsp. massiliense]
MTVYAREAVLEVLLAEGPGRSWTTAEVAAALPRRPQTMWYPCTGVCIAASDETMEELVVECDPKTQEHLIMLRQSSSYAFALLRELASLGLVVKQIRHDGAPRIAYWTLAGTHQQDPVRRPRGPLDDVDVVDLDAILYPSREAS